jgi:hypothetical protein|tara:strand:+ start:1927 stop:2349 length:423 start_codon:yes stop_codon:yes gene_type:complete
MPKSWDSESCNEKSGFLFNHECFQPPEDVCMKCRKPVCSDHGHEFLGDEKQGMLCTSCVKKDRKQLSKRQARDVGRSNGRDYYDSYNEPYFWGGYYYGATHHQSHASGLAHDPHDFTEADAESLQSADEGEVFETDMSES